MKIYVRDVPDVELDSAISEQELIAMTAAMQRGVAQSQIHVSQGTKKGLLDLRDIDIERTMPGVIFPRASLPPAA